MANATLRYQKFRSMANATLRYQEFRRKKKEEGRRKKEEGRNFSPAPLLPDH
ncbi:MAG: hypothetical protein HEQ24_02735 [Dolichospermum sp. BR01]|jgi:hypothetical protein|nr:hypothetical protein [Dolichospermum sp. BR01]